MASDTSDIQRIAVQNGSVIASPAPPRGPERRLGLAPVVISLAQLAHAFLAVPAPARTS